MRIVPVAEAHVCRDIAGRGSEAVIFRRHLIERPDALQEIHTVEAPVERRFAKDKRVDYVSSGSLPDHGPALFQGTLPGTHAMLSSRNRKAAAGWLASAYAGEVRVSECGFILRSPPGSEEPESDGGTDQFEGYNRMGLWASGKRASQARR